jgi:hypothetical protein
MIGKLGRSGRVGRGFFKKGNQGLYIMCDSDEDTAFTDHLLDQFNAYYTITVIAVHLFMRLKAHHSQSKSQEFTASKA